MLPTPQVDFNRTPVTLAVIGIALALEIVANLSPEGANWRFALLDDYRLGIWWQIWTGELWRPLTTTLMHGNLIHAAFNIYGLLIMGPLVEERLGSLRFLALFVVLAYVPILDHYLITGSSAVGLSGVAYGLFGLMWVGRRYNGLWAAVCNDDFVRLYMVWFFFCIIATRLEWMPVANIAHGVGLALGALIGLAIFRPRQRLAWSAACALVVGVSLVGLVWAPWHEGYQFVQHRRVYEDYLRAVEAIEAHSTPAGALPDAAASNPTE